MFKLFISSFLLLVANFIYAQCNLTIQLKATDGDLPEKISLTIITPTKQFHFDSTLVHIENLPCNTEIMISANAAGFIPLEYAITTHHEQLVTVSLQPDILQLAPVNVVGNWAPNNSPIAFTEISGKNLNKENSGRDLPMLLESIPSLITTSDAGNAIGYTGLRIRGSDQTRINVTINGVPVNEVESHSVFWVDLPDIASSVDQIQIQKGVGSSTFGSGSFGGNLSILTSKPERAPYVGIDLSAGSFNSTKETIRFGSGLLNNNWTLEGRASNIYSAGYVDRAKSDLQSLFLNLNYIGKKSVLRLIGFSGREETYQSWNGIPESRYINDLQGMKEFAKRNGFTDAQTANLINSGRSYNYYQYKNQVDHYGQDYLQLLYSIALSKTWHLSSVIHYTKGKGYYEELKEQDDVRNYGLSPIVIGKDTIPSANIVRRRWLSTDYYGTNIALKKETGNVLWSTGIAVLGYKGEHFGKINWIDNYPGLEPDYQYYYNKGSQSEINLFSKILYNVNDQISLFADLQYRRIKYTAIGIDNDRVPINIQESYGFFNPKAGINFQLGKAYSLSASLGLAHAQPLREDFTDAIPGHKPTPEKLLDIEIGLKKQGNKYDFSLNLYRMQYKDQLILTGELNDVGASIRTNVPVSYRTGIEGEFNWKISSLLGWKTNLCLSQNKIKDFTYILYDYENGGTVNQDYKNTEISYSPSIIAYSDIALTHKHFQLDFISKYVGRQYLDNTGNQSRSLDPYFVQDVRLIWTPKIKYCKAIQFGLQIYNFLNEQYANNGYTYSYLYGSLVTENFYYPQAGVNFMVSCSIRW